jgi:hypothetical protein
MTQELGADQLPIGSGRSPDNGVNPQFQSGFNAGYGQAQFDAAQTDAQGAAPLGEHKWFDPECGANGCQSLVWKSRCESAVKGRKDFRAAYKYVLRKLRTAEAQGAAPAGWPPREPTEAMQDAALDEAGWRVEPYTAPRESGVAIESDISADDAASINAECRESLADIWRAMWDAAPPSPALHAPTVEACAIVAEGFNAAVNSKAMKPFAHDPKLVSAVVHRDFAIADAIRALTSGAEAGERGGQTAAARDVLAERERQKSVEGWTTEHDDEHDTGDLARAAAAYARHAGSDEDTRQVNSGFAPEDLWPSEWGAAWKPSTRRCDLVKAGALILAEIERLDRASVTPDRGASAEPRPVPAKAEPPIRPNDDPPEQVRARAEAELRYPEPPADADEVERAGFAAFVAFYDLHDGILGVREMWIKRSKPSRARFCRVARAILAIGPATQADTGRLWRDVAADLAIKLVEVREELKRLKLKEAARSVRDRLTQKETWRNV